MKKIPLLLCIVATLFAINTAMASSLHKCFLLPITDSLEGTIGNALFAQIEENLQSSKWCDYQRNDGLIKILSKYNRKLNLALQNSDVIKLVGMKSKAGSIIRVKLKYTTNSIILSTDIIDDLGREYLFRYEEEMKSDKIEDLAKVVISNLNEYGESIPYQFQITEMMGNDLIGRIIGSNTFARGDTAIIERPVSPIRHPLLKKVVEWNTLKIGEASVEQVSPPFIRVKLTGNTAPPKKGDWGSLLRPGEKQENKATAQKYSKKYPDIFEVEASAIITRPYAHNSLSGTSEDLENKFLLGARGIGHLIITRNIWAELGMNYEIGLTGGVNSSSHTKLNFKTGWKFFPVKDMPGSFISPYIAYGNDTFDYNSDSSTQFVPTTFKVISLGLYGNHQVADRYDVVVKLNFGVSSKVQADGGGFSGSGTASTGEMELGVRYDYDKEYDIYGGINYSKYSAKFGNDELNYAAFNLVGGIVYSY